MPSILIVDDDSSSRDFLASVLSPEFGEIAQAADGREGLDHIESSSVPDLVIADLLMPTMDGFEFVHQLRRRGRYSRIPVVFCTSSYLAREARRLAHACGVNHVLVKPVEADQVLQLVRAVLANPESAKFTGTPASDDTADTTPPSVARPSPRIEAMIDLGIRLAEERDPRRLLEHCCAAARKIIGARYASVALLDRDRRSVRHEFASGVGPEVAAELAQARHAVPVQPEVHSERAPRRLARLQGAPQEAGLPAAHPRVGSCLFAPITSPRGVHGWLCLADKIGLEEFSDEDEGLARMLAAQVGRIYENSSLLEQLQRTVQRLQTEITQRNAAEAQLRDNQQRYQAIVRTTMDGFCVLDHTGKIEEVNDAFCAIVRRSRRNLLGRHFHDVDNQNPVEAIDARLGLIAKTGWGRFEIKHRREDGRTAVFEASKVHLTGRDVYLTFVRDLTEKRDLEAQLLRAQRLESVGRLASGVAHDLNNILAPIVIAIDLLRSDSRVIDTLDIYEMIEKNTRRGADIVRHLLMFARGTDGEFRPMNLALIVRDMVRIMRQTFPKDIDVRDRVSASDALVSGDATELHQVVMNLCVNARDAMPDGGALEIVLEEVEVDKERAAALPRARPGPHVLLTIADTGMGIPTEHIGRIFDPFFTTKPPGQGTGLGLSTVVGIVERHGGFLDLRTKPGSGTQFMVYLPTTNDQAAPEKPASARRDYRGRGELILIVDDESAVRQLLKRALETAGYRVEVGVDGADGLDRCDQVGRDVRLVLTDLAMPRLDGLGMIRELKTRGCSAPVIAMIGVEDEKKRAQLSELGVVDFINKPFDLPSLLELIERRLHAEDSPA